MKEFSGSSNIQIGWKYYQGFIHNIYHGINIETDHQFTHSMPEYVAKHFVFPKFTASGPGTFREVIDNDTTTRDKMSLNGLKATKGQPISVSMMLKTGMEAPEDHNNLNYGPPISK